jgi:hypothetical protein
MGAPVSAHPLPEPAPAMRALTLAALSVFIAFWFAAPARAEDAAPPTQSLRSDPDVPFPRIELSADGASIAFADYALRVDVAPERWGGAWLVTGLSRRHGGDALLIEVGGALWPLGWGLEGLWISPALGVAIAGPWNGESDAARSVLRFGGDVGWQLLWGDLAVALGAGATGFAALDGTGAVWVEPRFRAALGVVWR